jgi:hypothetical protein
MTGPNNQNQNQNQNQNPDPPITDPNQPNNSNSETQTLETPAPNTDVVPRTELNQTLEATHNLYRQALTEGESQRRQLQERLDAAERNRQSAPTIPDDQLTPAQLIERAVAAQVAPLTQQFDQFRLSQEQQTYNSIKNTFRQYPQLTQIFPQLEPYLDREMQGKPVTVDNVQKSLATVIGTLQMQMALNPQSFQQNPQQQQFNTNQNPNMNQNPNQNQNQNPQNQNLPPHLRPSAPPLPNRNGNANVTPNGNPMRPLSELEKRVAREQRPPLTDAQYIDWISESPSNVVHSQIGKTQT